MVLCSRSFPQLRATFDSYKDLADRDIEDAIEAETSGSLQDGFVAIGRSSFVLRKFPYDSFIVLYCMYIAYNCPNQNIIYFGLQYTHAVGLLVEVADAWNHLLSLRNCSFRHPTLLVSFGKKILKSVCLFCMLSMPRNTKSTEISMLPVMLFTL